MANVKGIVSQNPHAGSSYFPLFDNTRHKAHVRMRETYNTNPFHLSTKVTLSTHIRALSGGTIFGQGSLRERIHGNDFRCLAGTEIARHGAQ